MQAFNTHTIETIDMDFKIGETYHVIIPGFSPTVARIDNISERKGETFYYISFQEDHLYTICRVVSERALKEMIEKYDKNRDHLDDFMMKAGAGLNSGSNTAEIIEKEGINSEIKALANIELISQKK